MLNARQSIAVKQLICYFERIGILKRLVVFTIPGAVSGVEAEFLRDLEWEYGLYTYNFS